MSTSSSRLIDDRVGPRIKISALWIALLFLYAYGDIFGFFKPGQIEDIISGEISGIDITQGFLFAASVYVAIASVMIFLTLVLRPAAARWSNVVLAILYIATIVAAAIGESAYYWFLSAVEIAMLVLIVRYALPALTGAARRPDLRLLRPRRAADRGWCQPSGPSGFEHPRRPTYLPLKRRAPRRPLRPGSRRRPLRP